MNKTLIKKYKKEFDYWLDHPDNLLFKSKKYNYNQWRKFSESGDDWTWTYHYNDIISIIINDEYVEFRKALAEGKEVEKCLSRIHYPDVWQYFDKRCEFTEPVDCYRIKPEEVIESIEVKEPEIKIGDFVTFLDISNPNPKRVIDIKNDIAYTENNKCLISQCKLWKPTENDLVWKRNSKWLNKNESILSNFTEITEEIYDLVEPYIDGKSPSWIKQ